MRHYECIDVIRGEYFSHGNVYLLLKNKNKSHLISLITAELKPPTTTHALGLHTAAIFNYKARLPGGDEGMHFGRLEDEHRPEDEPDDAGNAQQVEGGRPGAHEVGFAENGGDGQREDGADHRPREDDGRPAGALVLGDPLQRKEGKKDLFRLAFIAKKLPDCLCSYLCNHAVHHRKGDALRQSLDDARPHEQFVVDHRREGPQNAHDAGDEEAAAEDPLAAELGGQHGGRYLRDDVAVEEGAQHLRLLLVVPVHFVAGKAVIVLFGAVDHRDYAHAEHRLVGVDEVEAHKAEQHKDDPGGNEALQQTALLHGLLCSFLFRREDFASLH